MFKRVSTLDGLYPPLFAGYVRQEAGVKTFYNGDFREEESYVKRASFLWERTFPQEARDFLVAYNSGLPLKPAGAWERKVLDKRTLFVVTGQQPALFASPLLVLYKSLAALKLARCLEERLHVPVQPMFWIASEDHNIPPLLSTYVPQQDGGITRVRIPAASGNLQAGMVSFNTEKVEELLQQLFHLFSDGSYKDEVMAWLSDTAKQGGYTLSGWFEQVMARLFAKNGLLLFDPLQAAAVGLYINPLFQALECHMSGHDQMAKVEEELQAAGYPLQVQRDERESLIMITWEGKRHKLLCDEGHYYTRGGELSLKRSELLKLIVESPSLFSPGVLMRPVFQDMLFPTLAYVAGPGELAYFAQNKVLYPLFNLELPLLYPRPGVTLVEPKFRDLALQHHINLQKELPDLNNRSANSGSAHKLKALGNNLWPRSSPQERVFNIVPYLFHYGFSFWDDFCYNFPCESGHYLYYLKEGAS